MSIGTIILLIAVLFCLAGCFCCAGSEISLLSVDRTFVKANVGKMRGAMQTQELISSMSLTISLILLGTNAFNSATSALVISLLNKLHQALPFLNDVPPSLLTTLIATPTILLFGEVVPKAIGMNNPSGFAFKTAPVLLFFRNLLLPILKLLGIITSLITKPFGGATPSLMAKEEVEAMTAMGRDDGILSDEECRLIKRVMDLSQQTLATIMTPMIELTCYPATMKLKDFLDAVVESDDRLFPVYRGRPENVEGIISSGKGVLAILHDKNNAERPLSDFIEKNVTYVPETVGAERLLARLRQERKFTVLAVNEYGAVTGLMTTLDAAEEIVGNFLVSHGYELIKLPDGAVECDARVGAEEVAEAINLNFDRHGYDTIGGLLLKHCERIPKEGEKFVFDKAEFTVLSASSRRIERLLVRRAE